MAIKEQIEKLEFIEEFTGDCAEGSSVTSDDWREVTLKTADLKALAASHTKLLEAVVEAETALDVIKEFLPNESDKFYTKSSRLMSKLRAAISEAEKL